MVAAPITSQCVGLSGCIIGEADMSAAISACGGRVLHNRVHDLSYRRSGRREGVLPRGWPDGRAIVLLHGYPSSSYFFKAPILWIRAMRQNERLGSLAAALLLPWGSARFAFTGPLSDISSRKVCAFAIVSTVVMLPSESTRSGLFAGRTHRARAPTSVCHRPR